MGTETIYNTDIIKMVHPSGVLRKIGNVLMYSFNNDTRAFIYKEDSDGVEINDIIRFQAVKNVIVIQTINEVLLYSVNNGKLVYRTNCIDYGYEVIYDESLVIIDKYKVINYIMSTGEIREINTKRNVIRSFSCKNHGRDCMTINTDNSIIVVDFRTGEILGILSCSDVNKNISAVTDKRYYADIIVSEYDFDISKSEPIYFICGKRILNTEDYLDFIGIEEIGEVTYKTKTIESALDKEERVVDYFNIKTKSGKTGRLSGKLNKLSINSLNPNDNILVPDFEKYKEQYEI